jgi:hypothetical protein
MSIRYHPWGMFTLTQSNFPVEGMIIDSVVFTTAVLCRGTNGYALRLNPLWIIPMFETTRGKLELDDVVPLYVHSITTSPQVTRFGTVKKAISPAGVVDIWVEVRQEDWEEERRSTSTGKILPSGRTCERYGRIRREPELEDDGYLVSKDGSDE